MPNSRNYCFHGSGHIIRKGGQELGLHRPWNMFPQTQSNYPHHAKTSFVWKGFCTNANDYFSPEWDGADFPVLHELFLLLRSQDHLRSLSLLGTSGLWRKNPPETRRNRTSFIFKQENAPQQDGLSRFPGARFTCPTSEDTGPPILWRSHPLLQWLRHS